LFAVCYYIIYKMLLCTGLNKPSNMFVHEQNIKANYWKIFLDLFINILTLRQTVNDLSFTYYKTKLTLCLCLIVAL
jgi:hypothetical protein